MDVQEQLLLLQDSLDQHGLLAGLEFLNKRVPHRFTAVYRLDGGFMRNVAIVDKLNELVPEALLTVPIRDSFCQFVLKDGWFDAAKSQFDPRLDGHPYKGVVNSYVGLPLSKTGEDLIGTFCHFDFPLLSVDDEEFVYLTKAAKLLPPYIR